MALGAGLRVGEQEEANIAEELHKRAQRSDRFSALTGFSDFETQFSAKFDELKRNAPPDGKGFVKQVEELYQKELDTFVGTKVAPDLQEEFRFRGTQSKQGILSNALDFQYKAGDANFRTAIDAEFQKSLKALDPKLGGAPDRLEAERAKVFEVIDASDLSTIEKGALKQKVSIGLEGLSYKQAYKAAAGGVPVSNDYEGAKALIRKEEGFRSDPYWDVNHDRVGYGSDTVTLPDGTVKRTTRGMKISREDAERDLDRRIKQFEEGAMNAIGDQEWLALSPNARAGLLSVAYNYGSLPNTVVRAARSGSVEDLAQAVAGLKANPARRAREAAIIRGGNVPSDANIDDNSSFSNLPYEDRVNLRADADRELAQEDAADRQARKLAIDTRINDLLVGISDGSQGLTHIDAAIEDGTLADFGDRKRVMDLFEEKNAAVLALQSAMADYANPSYVFDPTSTDDKKKLNALLGADGTQRLMNADQDYVRNWLNPLVSRAGDVPTDAMGTLTGMMRSNNNSQALFALDTLRQLREASPDGFNARAGEDLTKKLDLYEARRNLYPEDELLTRVRGGQTQELRQANAILETEAKSYLARDKDGVSNLRTLIAGVVEGYDGVFSSEPVLGTVPAYARQLDAEYSAAFTDAYINYGNVEDADAAARKVLKRTWGVADVGGEARLMKYPPQAVGYRPLTPGGDMSWLDNSIRAEMQLSPDASFELLSDNTTKREWELWQKGQLDHPPSYIVVTHDANGLPVPPKMVNGAFERRWFQPLPLDKFLAEKAYTQMDLSERRSRLRMYMNTGGSGLPPKLMPEDERLLREQYQSEIDELDAQIGDVDAEIYKAREDAGMTIKGAPLTPIEALSGQDTVFGAR